MLPGGRREVFSVNYDKKKGRWTVSREGGFLSGYPTKTKALNYAKRTAKKRSQDSVVVVFRKDGSRQKQIKYPKEREKSKDSMSGSYIGRKSKEFF